MKRKGNLRAKLLEFRSDLQLTLRSIGWLIMAASTAIQMTRVFNEITGLDLNDIKLSAAYRPTLLVGASFLLAEHAIQLTSNVVSDLKTGMK